MITGLALKRGWRGEDIRDAQQEGVLWMVEAIKDYDTNEVGKPGGCSFRSFLYKVLVRSFSNYARSRKRCEGHLNRQVTVLDEYAADTNRSSSLNHRTFVVQDCQPTPVTLAEQQEDAQRLRNAIQHLSETERRILTGIGQDKKLTAIATELGLRLGALSHRWRKLRRKLRELLG